MLSLIRRTLALGLSALAALPALAQEVPYPTRPITLVVGYSPGGSVDLVARAVAPELARRLGQQVVVENVAGAGGTLGAAKVAAARPDGYTLLLGSPSEVGINQLISKSARYDGLQDLTAVGMIGAQPLVLVAHPRTGLSDATAFQAFAARQPGKFSYASSGNGTPLHLAGELIKREGGVDLLHVPYRGATQMVTDLLGGQVDFAVFVLSSALPHIREGRMKAIGLTTRQRSAAAREIPTLAETPRFAAVDIGVWFGLFLPAKTPAPVVARLQRELREVLRLPEVSGRLEGSGVTMTPDLDAPRFVRDEVERFRRIVEFARIEAP
ncbi:MAG: Bug family tripartite tricarboxylate transporter substrate binding protein [Betaproteobacteria bacterium]|jgi:tripartite-type tricarboxylate transporter receptor subunit TctC